MSDSDSESAASIQPATLASHVQMKGKDIRGVISFSNCFQIFNKVALNPELPLEVGFCNFLAPPTQFWFIHCFSILICAIAALYSTFTFIA
jgi:hypothetical protein